MLGAQEESHILIQRYPQMLSEGMAGGEVGCSVQEQ